MTNLTILEQLINKDYSEFAFLISDFSLDEKKASQNQLNDLIHNTPNLFDNIEVESFIKMMTQAHRNGYDITSFENAASVILKDEKVFAPKSEIYDLIAVMNKFTHSEQNFSIIKNFIHILKFEELAFFIYDTERDSLHTNFLINVALYNNSNTQLKEKSYLWNLALDAFNVEFAYWLNDNQINYQYDIQKESIIENFFHYNLKEEQIPLIDLFLEKEKLFRQKNNLNIYFEDLLKMSIEKHSDIIFSRLVDKNYITPNNLAYYSNLLDITLVDYEEEATAQINMKNSLIKKEKEFIENKLNPNFHPSKKIIKM